MKSAEEAGSAIEGTRGGGGAETGGVEEASASDSAAEVPLEELLVVVADWTDRSCCSLFSSVRGVGTSRERDIRCQRLIEFKNSTLTAQYASDQYRSASYIQTAVREESGRS